MPLRESIGWDRALSRSSWATLAGPADQGRSWGASLAQNRPARKGSGREIPQVVLALGMG
jgi:hypothetical protein